MYKARHRKLNRIVALKVLPESLTADKKTLERFENEMRAIGSLDHPNIVRAQNADEVDGTHLLVMDYVDGDNLSTLIKRQGPLPVDEACDWIRQAALGLQHIHEAGMVHRDIKPGNLMLSKDGTVRILDLGLALLSEAQRKLPGEGITATGQVMGTLDYMAPEQADDTHAVDIRADIYSLGATFYALLTGQAPYAGRGDGSVLQKLKTMALEKPMPINEIRNDVPSAVVSVIERMMAKDPAERFFSPQEIVVALEAICLSIPPAIENLNSSRIPAGVWQSLIVLAVLVLGVAVFRSRETDSGAPGTGIPSGNDVTEADGLIEPGKFQSQRDVALWVLRHGGEVSGTRADGWKGKATTVDDLGDSEFEIHYVTLPNGTTISPQELRNIVSSTPTLKGLIMNFHQRLTREHVAALSDWRQFKTLLLGSCEPSDVDDASLSEILKHQPDMETLALFALGNDGTCVHSLPQPDKLVNLLIGSPSHEILQTQLPQLSVQWMERLSQFSNLEKLEMPRVELTREHIAALKNLPKLRTLAVYGAPKLEEYLDAFAMLPQLEELQISTNKITDAHLPALRECSHLKRLNIGVASVTSEAVEELQESLPYTEIQTDSRTYEPLQMRVEPKVIFYQRNHGPQTTTRSRFTTSTTTIEFSAENAD